GNMGTICNLDGGWMRADGGDLMIRCWDVLEGVIQRGPGGGDVNIDHATLQNVTIDPGAELDVTGYAALMASGTKLTNNGIGRVRGRMDCGARTGPEPISIGGNGTLILDGGILGSGEGATLVNLPGQTITGCGTINAPFVNQGTVNLDCPTAK